MGLPYADQSADQARGGFGGELIGIYGIQYGIHGLFGIALYNIPPP